MKILLSKKKNLELKFDINPNLMEEINYEEDEYQKYLEEEKERLSYLNLKVSFNDKIEIIKIKKSEKLISFKNKIGELYGINQNNLEDKINIENDSRIIIYNINNNKIINILNPKGTNEKTLEELNLTQNHIYHLNIKKPSEEFDLFDPDDIYITLVKWNDNFLLNAKNKIKSNIEENGIKIKINKKIANEEFIKTIKNSLQFEGNQNILIHKKQEYGYNNIDLITFKKENMDVKRFLSDDNLVLFIEE